MELEKVNSYVKYLTDVLGMQFFDFFDSNEIQEIERLVVKPVSWELGYNPTEQNHLFFLLEGDSWESIKPEVKELFLKVRASMKLNSEIQAPAIVALWNQTTLNHFISMIKSPVEFIFLEEDKNLLNPAFRVIGDHTLIVVPSIALMLRKQDYKRTAWERIKAVALKLNSK
jgi:hypothetical protein